jgi:hypothetical protein
MADIAKAYVQIIPSAEGIKGSLTDMFSGEASAAGMTAGTGFAGGMSKAIGAAKIGVSALAVTGAAVTAATGALVSGAGGVAAYGDNIDKMSQKMGISAQAYQEWDAIMQHSGTSIDALKPSMKTLAQQAQKGAEEFQMLGISEQEVATLSQEDLFAKVITGLQGMEEGTERTALTSKLLGRGATELGALLNTSAEDTEKMRQKVHELGGVMSDDAVKASAKFQDTLQDMSTGFDSLKRNMMSEFLPSITTVMDGMTSIFTGDQQNGIARMGEGIKQFISELTTVAPEAVNVAVGIVEAIGQGLLDNLPTLMSTVTDLFGQLLQKLPEVVTSLAGVLLPTIVEFANQVAEMLPQLMPQIVAMIMDLVTMFVDNADQMIDAAIALITALANGIIVSLPVLLEKAPELIQKTVDVLISNAPKLLLAAIEIVSQLAIGLVQSIPQILSANIQIISAIFDAFRNTDWLQIGIDIIKGIATGIGNTVGALVDAVKAAAQKALESAKNFLGIHSPSAVFRDDIGQMIDLGLAEGIEDYTSPIQAAMSSLSDMTQSGFSMATQAISSGTEKQPQLAMAGYGDLTIPVYIGNQKFGQAVVNANQINNYRSGGR